MTYQDHQTNQQEDHEGDGEARHRHRRRRGGERQGERLERQLRRG